MGCKGRVALFVFWLVYSWTEEEAINTIYEGRIEHVPPSPPPLQAHLFHFFPKTALIRCFIEQSHIIKYCNSYDVVIFTLNSVKATPMTANVTVSEVDLQSPPTLTYF